MNTYLPAPLIALWAGVSRKTAWEWAKRDEWRHVGNGKSRAYHIADVEATLAKLSTDTAA